jgi:hypothetical protein
MLPLVLRSLVLPFVLGIVGGCTRSPVLPASPPPAPAAVPERPDEELPASQGELPAPVPGPCATDGRLWDGKPDACSYEHGGCCYDSAPAACAAASCPVERCSVLESYPAQISCGG